MGAISAAAHVRTPDFTRLVASLAGDARGTAALRHDLLPLVDTGFAEPSPAVWKATLHARGEIATSNVRAPLLAASASATAASLGALGRHPVS